MKKSLDTAHQNSRELTLLSIQEKVNERGFYLYEWISQDEFAQSIKLQYFHLLNTFWTAIAVIPFLVVLSGGIFGVMNSIKISNNVIEILTANMFYSLPYGILATAICFIILTLFLIFWSVKNGNLYTKFTNVAITDNHIITGGKIISHADFSEKNPDFIKMSEIFHEPIFSHSLLHKNIQNQQIDSSVKLQNLFASALEYTIKMMENQSHGGYRNNKNNNVAIGSILSLLVIVIGGIFYAIMKIVHFVFLPIIALFSQGYSRLLHKILLITNGREYKIQSLFRDIDQNTNSLQKEKNSIQNYILNASNNEWKENLFGKILEHFNALNLHAKNSTDQSITLKKLLQNSDHNEIFNFKKYHIWIKNQIITPLKDLISLLEKNEKILEKTHENIQIQINKTESPDLQKPLILSKKRLEIQLSEFTKMKNILNEYISKLL